MCLSTSIFLSLFVAPLFCLQQRRGPGVRQSTTPSPPHTPEPLPPLTFMPRVPHSTVSCCAVPCGDGTLHEVPQKRKQLHTLRSLWHNWVLRKSAFLPFLPKVGRLSTPPGRTPSHRWPCQTHQVDCQTPSTSLRLQARCCRHHH